MMMVKLARSPLVSATLSCQRRQDDQGHRPGGERKVRRLCECQAGIWPLRPEVSSRRTRLAVSAGCNGLGGSKRLTHLQDV
jgi:hypothetical protein